MKPVIVFARLLTMVFLTDSAARVRPGSCPCPPTSREPGVRYRRLDHVAGLRSFDQADHVPRHGRHDPLILIGVAVAVVNVGHRLVL